LTLTGAVVATSCEDEHQLATNFTTRLVKIDARTHVLSAGVCRLSVTLGYCVQMAKGIIKRHSRSASPTYLVS